MIDVDAFPSDTSWLSEPTTGVHQFGGGSLYADLKLEGFLVRLKQFREKAAKAKSSSFLEFLLFKMHSLFLRMGIDHNEQSGFLHLAAELSADIKGLDGEERQREIEKYTTDLRRKGQVRQLRDNAG
jgi:hypothetical protein